MVARISQRDYRVGIVGLGYVGVPLVLAATRKGFRVLGFDIDAARVAGLNRGETGIRHMDNAAVARAVADGSFEATADFTRLCEPDAILIAVPTPLTRQREPDLSYVEKTVHAIAAHLRRGQLIVLESTTWPGTTSEIVKPILEATGLVSGSDFFLAFSPEREDPGNRNFSTASIPKVVGGDGHNARALADALYGAIVDVTVPVSSSATAEAVKLTENIFRAVNIALVNELKVVFDAMGIDVWEVIDAARTKPFGFMPFYPGPGLGGHCIPIDPFYLTWKAREFEFHTEFIELAGKINSQMPAFCVGKVSRALNSRRKPLNGSRVLVIGVAYKANVNDMRESPALKIIDLLADEGAQVAYHDPHVPQLAKVGLHSVPLDAELLNSVDAVAVVTAHDGIDWEMIAREAPLVVDFRNVVPVVDGKVWKL